jgi:alkylation response protein AidB-like acyl-CoA dehydrogenase
MDFAFSEEQTALRTSARAMLDRHCGTAVVRDLVERGIAPDSLWARMVELDWPALAISDAAGGVGQGFVEVAVLAEELGRAIAPGPFLATVTQFAPLVRECGTPEQRDRFLRAVATGSTGTLAMSGPAGDWRPHQAALTARPRSGGGWLLDGSVHHVLDGGAAEIATVARLGADSDGDGVAAFVVPQGAARAEPVQTLDPSRPLTTLVFESVTVPDERVLGTPGRCAAGVGRAVEEATVALALEMVGTCQRIFDTALDYAKTREQFGVAIGSFQAIKHKFADMFVALERARATAYFAALTIAEDDERRTLAASMAKVAAGDCSRLLAQEGIQTMGGIGYTWEHDMQLFAKRAKQGELLLGTSAQHRQRVAELIGLTADESTAVTAPVPA